MRVISYIRFSSLEQGKGDSLRRQIEMRDEWCRETGNVIDDAWTLKDLGRSAFKGDNAKFGALRALLDLVRNGEIEKGAVLLIESFDRLSRESVLPAVRRLLELIEAGITVITLADRQEYSEERLQNDWTPLLISITIMSRAHEESRLKSERVGKAWAKKRLAAQQTGKAQTEICPGWLRKVGDHYELIEDRAELVRGFFRDTINGLGRRTITSRLNDAEVPTWGVGKKKGSRWHDSYVQKILLNPAAYGVGEPLGKIAGGDGSVPTMQIAGYYPAVIEEATFFAAQAAAKGRATGSGGKPGAHRNALRDIARCGYCGANMNLVDKGSRSIGPKLICGAAHARSRCKHRSYYRYATAEMSVVFGLGQQMGTLTASARDQAAKIQGERAALVAKQEALQTRLDNLIELAAQSGGGASVAAQVAKLQTEVDAVGNDIKKLDRDGKLVKAAEPSAASNELSAIYARIKGLEGQELIDARALMAQRMKTLVQRIDFKPERVVIHYADGSVGGFMPIVHESRKRTAAWMPAQSMSGTSPA